MALNSLILHLCWSHKSGVFMLFLLENIRVLQGQKKRVLHLENSHFERSNDIAFFMQKFQHYKFTFEAKKS